MSVRVEQPSLRSVATSTQVLHLFEQHEELGPTQVARELRVAKSTAHQMLKSLSTGGLLDSVGKGRYRLSLQLFDYGQLVLARLPIRKIARPELVALHDETGQMVQLGLPAHGYVVYVERFGHDPLRPQISGEWMRKVEGYASSAGRAMAAVDPDIERATFSVPRKRQTARTVVREGELRHVLSAARGQGWVQSIEESAPGFTSIASAVRHRSGRAVCAVSVVGPTQQLTGRHTDRLVSRLLHTTATIGKLYEQSEE